MGVSKSNVNRIAPKAMASVVRGGILQRDFSIQGMGRVDEKAQLADKRQHPAEDLRVGRRLVRDFVVVGMVRP